MKIIANSRICRYCARIGIFLIVIALVVCIPGCTIGDYVALTINSTEGGSVTVPGEGTFTYFVTQCCLFVDLVAEGEEGYLFIEWTGDVYYIENFNDATTNIYIGPDASITANFGHECTPMVAAGGKHTVGLKNNGRVVAVGDNYFGQCDVGDWRNIDQVAAG